MYYKKDNISLYYEKYGNKAKSIIILPGWGDTRKTFSYMISFLENFFTVYIIDYPGFGNTNFPNYDLTIYNYSDLIYEWINELNIKDPILIGHSFGGRIISVLLGYYKYNFSNIILINSAGIKPKKTIKKRIKNYSYKLLKCIGNMLPKKIKNKWNDYFFKRFASVDYLNLNENMRKTFKNIVNEDLSYYIKNINSKTLIIWGDKDDSTILKDAYTINKLIKDSELIILEDVGHFSYLEKPNLVNKIIFEQLKNDL